MKGPSIRAAKWRINGVGERKKEKKKKIIDACAERSGIEKRIRKEDGKVRG